MGARQDRVLDARASRKNMILEVLEDGTVIDGAPRGERLGSANPVDAVEYTMDPLDPCDTVYPVHCSQANVRLGPEFSNRKESTENFLV